MSKPASHPPAAQLRAYSLGQLGDGESRLIERHLMSCTECKQHLFEIPATDNFVDWLQKVHRERSSPAHPRDEVND
jgi:anti-sigma factor RsiW